MQTVNMSRFYFLWKNHQLYSRCRVSQFCESHSGDCPVRSSLLPPESVAGIGLQCGRSPRGGRCRGLGVQFSDNFCVNADILSFDVSVLHSGHHAVMYRCLFSKSPTFEKAVKNDFILKCSQRPSRHSLGFQKTRVGNIFSE